MEKLQFLLNIDIIKKLFMEMNAAKNETVI